MNLFSLVSAILLVILLTAFMIMLLLAIIFNMKIGAKYRTVLARKLHALRMGSMLTALGIDAEVYLHSIKISDIHRQMERCSACDNTAQCDEKLSNNNVDSDDIDFCSNKESFKSMLNKTI